MSYISIKVNLTSLEESNFYLRALWSELRKDFGHLSWLYQPRKRGNKRQIIFGIIDLGSGSNYEVSLTYMAKGTIEKIVFSSVCAGKNGNDDLKKIEACVKNAKLNIGSRKQLYFKGLIYISIPYTFHRYESEHFSLIPSNPGYCWLSFKVDAYDSIDGQYEYNLMANAISWLLSSFTNTLITSHNITRKRHAQIASIQDFGQRKEIHFADSEWEFPTPENLTEFVNEEKNSCFSSDDWLDGRPYQGGRKLTLSQTQLIFIGEFLKGKIKEDNVIIVSSGIFREALFIYERSGLQEVCSTILVSALEAVNFDADIAKTCPTCGQQTRRISARVRDLVNSHLGECAADLVKKAYESRSKFVHTGRFFGRMSYANGMTLPQLNPSDPSGCVRTRDAGVPINNLLEFTSYIIRAECLRFMVQQTE